MINEMEYNMNCLTFNVVREIYKNLRILELYRIKEHFSGYKDKDFKVTYTKLYQGQKGCDNWLGLDIKTDRNNNKKAFFISLQPFGHNSDNGNDYVVMDRIGLYEYENPNGKLTTKDALTKMEDLQITLPMNDEKLEHLAEILKNKTR